MKKRILLFLAVAVYFAGLNSCGTNNAKRAVDALPFSPYVEAFTNGKISRTTPVYLILTEDVPEEKMTPAVLKKAMKIRPDVKGEFSFENSRTIVFKPATEFARDKEYAISADLSQFFDTGGKDRDFVFKFTTYPLTVRGRLESLNVNPDDEEAYQVVVVLFTPDNEPGDVVESIVEVSEKADRSWEHSADGKTHKLTLSNVKGGKKNTKTMQLSVGSNKLGAAKDDILSVHIPAQKAFGVYDVQYVTEPERFIEVTMTKNLDESQDIDGLAWVEESGWNVVRAEANKIRIYPSGGVSGSITVRLSANLRASNGAILDEEVTRRIDLTSDVPSLEFLNSGVILPNSSQLVVPFKAVYLRGVTVQVIKILEQNIGYFLQENRMNGGDNLVRVGRLITRKTIFLDEDGQDLTHWGTYAIDLRELIEPEPGAIYRIELSFDRELSVYPCDGPEPKSKEQILADDEVKFREVMNTYDTGDLQYYDLFDYYWWDYDWDDRNDPCSNYFYRNTTKSRNVLATNIGLIAKSEDGGSMVVMAHDILTAGPMRGVEIRLHNFQNQIVGSGTTDENGMVRVNATGRPYYVHAQFGKQRSYLRVDDATSLSTSSFDVSGEVVQKGLKGFIYGDRGVWRPGDVVYLSFMLGDKGNTLPKDHPVVLEVTNPLGQLYSRKTLNQGVLGLYCFEVPIDDEAPTGSWHAKVTVGGVTFEKTLRIETIKPNRLKIDIDFGKKFLTKGEALEGDLHIEWLQGATARNLKYEIDATLAPVKTTFNTFKDFIFDDVAKTFETEETPFAKGTTDEKGDAKINGRFSTGDSAPGMLSASFLTKAYEESGDFSIDVLSIPYAPYSRFAGLKSPQKGMDQLQTDAKHRFAAVSVNPLGEPVAGTNLTIEIYRVEWHWWWNANYERLANYMSNSYYSRSKTIEVKTGSNGIAEFDVEFAYAEWGTYYVVVKDKESGHSAGMLSYFDWPGWAGRRGQESGEAATLLSFTVDKDTYSPGEKAVVTVPSADGSRAIVSVETGSRVVQTTAHMCNAGETRIEVPITEAMLPNAYIYVTLLQPHGVTLNDLPIRMYGVRPITVSSPKSHLNPVLKAPEEIKPESKYEIIVSEKDGREMAYTVAIIDEGLLDLTRFRTPDPWNAFNAREALGVRTWDLYNYIIGAYGGRLDQIFSIGGDDALGTGPKAIVNRFKPVVQFDGPFLLEKGARQKHTYTMPNYNGRVRVMIVAGDGTAYGNAEKSVFVRKPVMLLGTLPRVIGVGEEMVVPATIFATKENVGKVTVSISCSGNMQVVGPATQELTFKEITDKQAFFRVKVGDKPGAGKVTLTAVAGGDRSEEVTDIEVRSVRRKQVRTVSETIEPGKTYTGTAPVPGADGTNSLALEISDVQPLNLTSRLGFLLGYPHGCIEQITSKGFPQLYINKFANMTQAQAKLAESSVNEVIRRHKSYQVAEGGFAYWPGTTGAHSWGSIYAVHFQTEASKLGYHVPDEMNKAGIAYLKLVARNWKSTAGHYSDSEQVTQAYRLYVLALSGNPEIGAMNRLREVKELRSNTRWLLAAAYLEAGRDDIARSMIEATNDIADYKYGQYDFTFGSNLRDKAIKLMVLTALGDGAQASKVATEISDELSSDHWMSTQTTGFALIGMSQFVTKYMTGENMTFRYNAAGKNGNINTNKHIWSETLMENGNGPVKVEVTNNGKSSVFLKIISEGIPMQGEEEAYASSIGLDVSYIDVNGRAIETSDIEQGTNFRAVVTVRNPSSTAYNNIVLTQIFPSGWEILNTRFTEYGGDETAKGISYQDIRDDRVYSYIDRLPSGTSVTVTINLAAVYEGSFYLPPVWCEAMYDNEIRANTRGEQTRVSR